MPFTCCGGAGPIGTHRWQVSSKATNAIAKHGSFAPWSMRLLVPLKEDIGQRSGNFVPSWRLLGFPCLKEVLCFHYRLDRAGHDICIALMLFLKKLVDPTSDSQL